MAEFPALPLFTDAFQADTDHLDDTECGIYLRLLMVMWRTPDCRLPNDDEWLARRFRRTVEDVQAELRPIIREFCQTDGNWITQKRLTRERSFVRKQRKANTENAKRRWQKEKDVCDRTTGPHTFRNAPTPTPKDSEPKGSSGEAPPLPPDPVDEVWARGLRILGEKRRSLLGKLVSKYGPVAVLAAIAETENECPVEPVDYFLKCCERLGIQNGKRFDPHGALIEGFDIATR